MVAQQFTAGCKSGDGRDGVPEGRLKNGDNGPPQPSLRDWHNVFFGRLPSTEVLGYHRPSLRD